MTINEFHAKLSSENNPSAVFGALRKLMSLSDLKPLQLQDPTGSNVSDGGWIIWNENGGVALTA